VSAGVRYTDQVGIVYILDQYNKELYQYYDLPLMGLWHQQMAAVIDG